MDIHHLSTQNQTVEMFGYLKWKYETFIDVTKFSSPEHAHGRPATKILEICCPIKILHIEQVDIGLSLSCKHS